MSKFATKLETTVEITSNIRKISFGVAGIGIRGMGPRSVPGTGFLSRGGDSGLVNPISFTEALGILSW